MIATNDPMDRVFTMAVMVGSPNRLPMIDVTSTRISPDVAMVWIAPS